MYRFIFFILFVALKHASAQTATVVKFEKLEGLLETKSDQLQVINFWATWCAPCVKELPFFEALNAKNDPKVKVILVNLDYADKLDIVNAFIDRKKMKSEVLLLDEIDYNAWIDRIDPGWGGAIPATLFINHKTGQRKFVDKELKEGELQKIISELKE